MARRESLTEYIESRADESVRKPTIGRIQNVFAHDDPDDFWNHEVNAITIDGVEEFRKIPVHVQRNGHVIVPEQGDVVEIGFLGSTTQSAYIQSFVYTGQTRAPLARSGHWKHRFGDSSPYLFIEAETSDHTAGQPDLIRIGKKTDGLSDPSATIELDDSGTDPIIKVKRQDGTEMGIELDFGTGEFKIGDGSGYGIVSDGNGNFTWYENTVDFVDDGSTITW